MTRRTAHVHQARAATIASVGSGSNVQPNSSETTVGGSAGVGPCAATGPARSRLPATAATAASHGTSRRDVRVMRIGGIVPRSP